MLGYSPAEMAGKSFKDLTARTRADNVDSFIKNKLWRIEPFAGAVFELLRKDGRTIFAEVNGYPIIINGVLQGFKGIVKDATNFVCEKTLNTGTQAELFLDLVCHDINNLNQICLGYLELANQSVSHDNEASRYLAKCIETLISSSSLIANVQKLQKINSCGMTLVRVDMDKMLLEVIDQYQTLPDKSVVIDYQSIAHCCVMANELLKDALSNILSNAIKHANESQVIEINVYPVTADGKNYCLVKIADHGPGIPDGIKEKLFNRFQRGETSTMGNGLGLYLVKELIESFHGRVWVENRVAGDNRQGSCFIILLPVAD